MRLTRRYVAGIVLRDQAADRFQVVLGLRREANVRAAGRATITQSGSSTRGRGSL
jgi:hypothetical protein